MQSTGRWRRQHADADSLPTKGARPQRSGSPHRSKRRAGFCFSAWAVRMPSAAPSNRSIAPLASRRSPSAFRTTRRTAIDRRQDRSRHFAIGRKPRKWLRWFRETDGGHKRDIRADARRGAFLAKPCLRSWIRRDGRAFAATRSLTVTFALHWRSSPPSAPIRPTHFTSSTTPRRRQSTARSQCSPMSSRSSTSGRKLQGLAEAIALGLTELSRLPCFFGSKRAVAPRADGNAGPSVGVVLFRAADPTAKLVGAMAPRQRSAARRLSVFDASGEPPLRVPRQSPSSRRPAWPRSSLCFRSRNP